jgi:hypothetical protein
MDRSGWELRRQRKSDTDKLKRDIEPAIQKLYKRERELYAEFDEAWRNVDTEFRKHVDKDDRVGLTRMLHLYRTLFEFDKQSAQIEIDREWIQVLKPFISYAETHRDDAYVQLELADQIAMNNRRSSDEASLLQKTKEVREVMQLERLADNVAHLLLFPKHLSIPEPLMDTLRTEIEETKNSLDFYKRFRRVNKLPQKIKLYWTYKATPSAHSASASRSLNKPQ